MIRLAISILCLIPSPLLASQPGSTLANPQVIIPRDAQVPLVALETVSSATAKEGDAVRFAVTKNLVFDGVTVIPAGATVIGKVAKVKCGVPKSHVGYLKIRLLPLKLGSGAEVRFTSADPMYTLAGRRSFHHHARNALDNVRGVATCAVLLPLCIALDLGLGDDKPDGRDAVLPTCFPTQVWTAHATSVQFGSVAGGLFAQAKNPQWMPQTCIDGFKIDSTVSGGEMLVID